MSLDCFLGKWQEEQKDGFDSLADAIDVPADKKDWYRAAKTEISYARDGDQWVINVGMAGVPDCRVFKFQLGQPYDSASIDGSPMESVITADGNRFIEQHTFKTAGEGLTGVVMNIARWIDGQGKMVVETQCKDKKMTSLYKRL